MDSPINPDILPPANFASKIKGFHEKYERYIPAGFFSLGFIFDIVTLSRIDDWFVVVQQFVYIFICLQILKFRTFEEGLIWTPSPRVQKVWKYNIEALHFLLGSLLSSYTLFYFVSSSLATSFIFLFLIFALLIINELPMFQSQGLKIKYALFALCVYSYLFILAPLSFGFTGVIPFLTAIAIGTVILFYMHKSLKTRNLINLDTKKVVFAPSALVAATLVTLYFLKILPPIPLSIQYMGIYHSVDKEKTESGSVKFLTRYSRSPWRFWENGAQTFVAYPADKIHCFVRIFAPHNFSDEVIFHWMKKYPRGWMTMDKIPNKISGGRDEGFRGYAIKSNYEPGEWRVQVETKEGHEIGRINFEVIVVPAQDSSDFREFKLDTF